MQVDFKQRCLLSRKIKNCQRIIHFFDYFGLMYCNFNVQTKTNEIGIVCIFIMIAIALMLTLVHILGKYFGAVLKIMSVKLHMNEYVAGATLLSFANAIPDLVVNLMPVREEAPLFTIAISNALAVILLSGGIVCFLRPFKINGHCAMRDLLFLMLACEIMAFIVISGKRTTQIEAILLVLLYIFYFVIIIVDLKLARLTIKSLKKQINELHKNTSTPYRTRLLHEKELLLNKLEKDNILLIQSDSVSVGLYNMQRRASSDFKQKGERRAMNSTEGRMKPLMHMLKIKALRNILHNPSNPRNLFLCSEFWQTLLPIDMQDWKLAGCCKRLYLMVTSPIVLLCTIFIPIIDYQQPKHGWSKLLNCLQIIITPILLIALTEELFTLDIKDWHVTLGFRHATWSMFLTVPLAIIVLFQTRTDRPPRYHLLFLSLTAMTAMLIIITCAIELEVLCCIIGLVLNLTENFVASCVRSLAAAVADLIMNVEVAMQGYERMAFAAVLAGPLFSITVCIGIPCYFNKFAQLRGSSYWIYGRHATNSHIFFALMIFTTMVWTLTFNFSARRSAGIFSFIMFILFLLYAALAEWNCVHDLSYDRFFEPQ
ncbi:mitochondrial sodium/calcium exchanger protein-like isoform X2 [Drosophila montana]